MQLKDLQAYEILEKRPIKDLNSEGIILRHKKSGARIAVISNDDEDLSQTPAAQELESALQGRNVAYRLEGEPGQLRMIVLMPRAGE